MHLNLKWIDSSQIRPASCVELCVEIHSGKGKTKAIRSIRKT